jgi:putative ABC transport system permease protein
MRNKLFAGISLFGISLTLTILIIGASFYDYFTKSSYPTYKQERILYASMLESWKKPPGEKDNSYSNQLCSYYFLDKCFSNLDVPQRVTFYNLIPRERATFINSYKFELLIKYCDEDFWNILDFRFIAGRPFNKRENDNSEKVAVIVESLAKDIFGEAKLALGKTIPIDDNLFTVVGVVKDVPMTNLVVYANTFCPITTSQENIHDKKLHGNFCAMVLANKRSDFEAIEAEINKSLKIFQQTELPLDYRNYIEMDIGDSLTRFIQLTPVNKATFYMVLWTVIFITIIVPSLNLINLNVNRINERLVEIGIRKTFGASRSVLIWQLIIENIVLTLLGGIIALVLTFAVLVVLQYQGIIPSEGFLLNYRILLNGLAFCFLFGFIAGILPAYRMSRLQIVESLKKGE